VAIETDAFQAASGRAKSHFIPEKNLYSIPSLIAKGEQMPRKRVKRKAIGHH